MALNRSNSSSLEQLTLKGLRRGAAWLCRYRVCQFSRAAFTWRVASVWRHETLWTAAGVMTTVQLNSSAPRSLGQTTVVLRSYTTYVRWLIISSSCEFASNTNLVRTGSLYGGSVVEWLGRRTHDSTVEGSPPGHDTAWLFISETGDRLWGGGLSWEL